MFAVMSVLVSLLLSACGETETNKQAERSGEMVFNEYCFACHQTGAVGAPKLGDQQAWAPYEKKGLPAMLEKTIHGYGRMPRMGTCFECSEVELAAAIEYMVGEAEQ